LGCFCSDNLNFVEVFCGLGIYETIFVFVAKKKLVGLG
jgi:hypothetical protein